MGTLLVISKVQDGIESMGSYLCAEEATPEQACGWEMSGCAGEQPLTHFEYWLRIFLS